MFSTLLGALPPDPARIDVPWAERVRSTVTDLEATGLELLADAEPLDWSTPPDPSAAADSWSRAQALTSHPLKAVVPGPYSAAFRAGDSGGSTALGWAESVRSTIAALAAAGCPLVEVVEGDALAIGVVAAERRRFVAAHRRLAEGAAAHLSLTITGGNVDRAGPATFFDLGYSSYAFDLIDGPDNWRLIAAAPADRGIVCGALSARAEADLTREVLVWAAHYAASTNGRGLDRVGLANASSLAGLSRETALARLAIVAEAATIAAVDTTSELHGRLDPRTVGRRRARRSRP